VFSVTGVCYTPLTYSLHCVMHMVDLSKDLQNVLLSVTTNGRALLVTAIFGAYTGYLFAIFAFLKLQAHYVDDGNRRCDTLWKCTVITINGGLRSGDVGEMLTDTEWPCEDGDYGSEDCEGHTMWVLAFEFLFCALFVIILLNIIFGIIIDTFGELREEKGNTEDDIENRCFTCGYRKEMFERLDGGFTYHIKREHYMWHYLFFMVHLGEKDQDDYTGPESYVHAQLQEQEIEWIPTGKAMSLQAMFEKEEADQQQLSNTVNANFELTKELQVSLQKFQETVDVALERYEEANGE